MSHAHSQLKALGPQPRVFIWLKRLVVFGLLFGVVSYTVAEEIILTTYYPSPRGVYRELRTQSDMSIGDLAPPSPAPRLRVVQDVTATTTALHVIQEGAAPAVQVEDQTGGDPSPFVIDQNGLVGIGTATPSESLVIGNNGNLLFQATASDPGDLIFRTSAGAQKGRIWSDPSATVALHLSSGDAVPDLTVDPTGNVGIGLTAPTAKVHIVQPSAANAFRIDDQAAPDPDPLVVDQFGNMAVGLITPTAKVHIVQPNPAHALRIDDQAADPDPLVVDQSGNVGVGLTAPAAKVHIVQAGAANALQVVQTGTGNAVQIDDQAGDPTPFLIDQDGHVAINRSSTDADTPVVIDSGSFDHALRIEGNPPASQQAAIYFHYAGSARSWEIGQHSHPIYFEDGFSIHPNSGEGSHFRITESGSVGIGERNPQNPGAPNGDPFNLNVNDIYLRSTGQWVSQSASPANGTLSLVVPTGTVITTRVDFGITFPTPPTVLVSISHHFSTSNPVAGSIWTEGVDTTGFFLKAFGNATSDTDMSVSWIAVQ